MSTTSTNAEGVTTITIGSEADGIDVVVIPADAAGPLKIEIEGYGSAAIDGGVRLDRDQAAELAARLFEQLTG